MTNTSDCSTVMRTIWKKRKIHKRNTEAKSRFLLLNQLLIFLLLLLFLYLRFTSNLKASTHSCIALSFWRSPRISFVCSIIYSDVSGFFNFDINNCLHYVNTALLLFAIYLFLFDTTNFGIDLILSKAYIGESSVSCLIIIC